MAVFSTSFRPTRREAQSHTAHQRRRSSPRAERFRDIDGRAHGRGAYLRTSAFGMTRTCGLGEARLERSLPSGTAIRRDGAMLYPRWPPEDICLAADFTRARLGSQCARCVTSIAQRCGKREPRRHGGRIRSPARADRKRDAEHVRSTEVVAAKSRGECADVTRSTSLGVDRSRPEAQLTAWGEARVTLAQRVTANRSLGRGGRTAANAADSDARVVSVATASSDR